MNSKKPAALALMAELLLWYIVKTYGINLQVTTFSRMEYMAVFTQSDITFVADPKTLPMASSNRSPDFAKPLSEDSATIVIVVHASLAIAERRSAIYADNGDTNNRRNKG